MTHNDILRRIYQLHPSIGTWARSGINNVLWNTADDAKSGIAAYIGPGASSLITASLHITGADLALIRSDAALQAMHAIIDAIYHRRPLIDGLFPEVDLVNS